MGLEGKCKESNYLLVIPYYAMSMHHLNHFLSPPPACNLGSWGPADGRLLLGFPSCYAR